MKKKLIEEAIKAREKAYVPYSNFKVGAALLTEDGEIYTGCNIENSSYGLSNCAERTAIFNAISNNQKNFKKIAIVADTDKPCTPCGACRQVIIEFGEDIEVIMANLKGEIIEKKIADLLWGAFTEQSMD